MNLTLRKILGHAAYTVMWKKKQKGESYFQGKKHSVEKQPQFNTKYK
jgi:hypothetical protein